MRTVIALSLVLVLGACTTATTTAVTACPPVPAYDRPFLARAAEEVGRLPEGSAIEAMLRDYAMVRDQLRACSNPGG